MQHLSFPKVLRQVLQSSTLKCTCGHRQCWGRLPMNFHCRAQGIPDGTNPRLGKLLGALRSWYATLHLILIVTSWCEVEPIVLFWLDMSVNDRYCKKRVRRWLNLLARMLPLGTQTTCSVFGTVHGSAASHQALCSICQRHCVGHLPSIAHA